MKLRKIGCLLAAGMLALWYTFPAYADDDKEEEKVLESYWENEEMMTDDKSSPTLSFDMNDWKTYIHSTNDASLIDLEAKQESDYAYQGRSLKLTASTSKDIDQVCEFAWLIRDENNELVYPEADEDDYEFLRMGVELHANEFGMTYFDGSMITFDYRLNPDVKGLLMGDSCFVAAYDDDYERLKTTSLRLEYNDTDSNNTTQYAKGVMSIADNIGATKIIIEVPLIKTTEKIDVLYIDNIQVQTKTGKYVGNLDGYNSNAKPEETVKELQVKAKENTISTSSSEAEESSGAGKVIMYVVIIILAIALVVFAVFMIIKLKNRFY